MGLYNVEKPCVVGLLHYVHVPDRPIEIDDEVAAPLLESGELTPYRAGAPVAEPDGELVAVFDTDSPTEKPRTRRKATED